MEPDQRYALLLNFKNAPIRIKHIMKLVKERLGFNLDDDLPWIFRRIPDAEEKCLSIEVNHTSIIIRYLKYRYTREEILHRWKEGRRIEGYYFRNNIVSTRGWFCPMSLYDEFRTLEVRTLVIPREMSVREARIRSLELYCDGDSYLIPRTFVRSELNSDLNMCFLSNVAMEYLLLNRNSNRTEFHFEFLSRFYSTVFLDNQAFFYYATIEENDDRRLAYVLFSHDLYLMDYLLNYYNNYLPFDAYRGMEDHENRRLPRNNFRSSITDFEFDINFHEFELVHTINGLVARRIQRPVMIANFEEIDPVDISNISDIEENRERNTGVYEQCEVFLFKSSYRYYYHQEKIQDMCSICLIEFGPNDLVKLFACKKHIFHMSCIDRWVEVHGFCPLCKYDLSLGLAQDDDDDKMNLLLRKRNHD